MMQVQPMDGSHLRALSGVGGVAGEVSEYAPIGGSDSDDSRSNTSRSDVNIPGIVYTSDDSADVGQSDSTYIDSEGPGGFIGPHPDGAMDEEGSRRLLLDSECTTPQPSPQVSVFETSHPLAGIYPAPDSALDNKREIEENERNSAFHSGTHLQISNENDSERSNSMSSSSTGSSPEVQQLLLPEYHPFQDFQDDFTAVTYEPLDDDRLAIKKIHQQTRLMVGSVAIDPDYANAFYAKWNWGRIRQMCVLFNLSTLVALLFMGIALIVQMPQGSDCDPYHQWWQGSVMYKIYVPSFQDSDGDGIGDITGVINRLDHIEGLGVKIVHLETIFQAADYMSDHRAVSNYSGVDPLLGTRKDLHLLSALLHERNMHMLLDFPVVPLIHSEKQNMLSGLVSLPNKNVDVSLHKEREGVAKLEVVPALLHQWLSLGVDGFAFPDIEDLVSETGLLDSMHQWRNVLDSYHRGHLDRIMMVPVGFLEKMHELEFPHLDRLITILDLIDAPLDLSGVEKLPERIQSVVAWDAHQSFPWINWHIAAMAAGHSNPAVQPYNSIGATIFLLTLPGTVSIHYGDEISLHGPERGKLEIHNWTSIMQWTDKEFAGFSTKEPWKSLNPGWRRNSVQKLNYTIEPVRQMIKLRQEKVPIYVNGIFNYEGDYHPTKATNYKMRIAKDGLVVLDRFYPRRHQYAVISNLSPQLLDADISHLYYGGGVAVSSHAKEGYLIFKNVSLSPGEGLLCILDK